MNEESPRRRRRHDTSSESSSPSPRRRSRSRSRSRRSVGARGRGRSVTRRNSAGRSRSRQNVNRRIEDHTRDDGEADNSRQSTSDGRRPGDTLAEFRSVLNKQQATIEELLKEQKQELSEKVLGNKHQFRNNVLSKQHEVNSGFLSTAKKIKKAIERQSFGQASSLTEDLINNLESHSEDLTIADLSRNGWLTVQRLRNKCSLPSSLLKQLEKVDDQIDSRKRKYDGGDGKNFNKRFASLDISSSGDPPRTNNNPPKPNWRFQKKTPEQILEEASKQVRAGKCSHCDEEGHFMRECPGFWAKVGQVRKTNAEKK